MSKNTHNIKTPSLSSELIIDDKGRLRINAESSKGVFQRVGYALSPSAVFLTCGILAILLIDVLLFIFANGLQQRYLLHNLEAKTLFAPFTAMILLGVTGSLSLLLFVIYKINLSNLQKGKVLVEVDTEK